jgi:N-formylglutamate amidohydrolase
VIDQVFRLKRGSAPLLVSIPHAGTQIPADIAASMTPIAREVDDTDWHLERLYAFAAEMGASILMPANSRYVIDLNRPILLTASRYIPQAVRLRNRRSPIVGRNIGGRTTMR